MRFSSIGLGAQINFDLAAQPSEIQAALKSGVKAGFETIKNFIKQGVSDPVCSGKVFGTREFLQRSAQKNYGQNTPNLLRAAASHIGLYGNCGEEAVYPTYLVDAAGQPFDASTHRYTLTFAKGTLPPVAVWRRSFTGYRDRVQPVG